MMNSFSIESEQAVLGAILVDSETNHAAIEFTEHDHFTTEAHVAIWQAVEQHIRDNLTIDLFSVAQTLQGRSELERSGGMEYLDQLCEGAHSINPILVRQYWKVLDNHRTRRRTEAAAMAVLAAVRDVVDIDDMLDECQRQLNSISQNVNADTITMDRALDGMLERMERLQALKTGELIGQSTGVDELDNLTMGREPGLHVIAARPGMGKTVLAMQGVLESARNGNDCLVISLEMPCDQLASRCVSSISSLNMQRLKDPRSMTDDDNQKLAVGTMQLKDFPIEFLDKMDSKLSKITQTIRAWHRRSKSPGVVVIDYLQLIEVTNSKSQNEAVSEITRRLKMLSNELGMPISLVSQLNRSLEQRPNKRPIPSDLRDSGSVEQDADTITFIYRDEIYDENTQYKGVAELIVPKQRNGPIGTVFCSSELHYMRFGNLIDYSPPETEKKQLRSKF